MADQINNTVAGQNNRIKYALLHSSWVFAKNSLSQLQAQGNPVLVSEYETEMKGRLFCPSCGCPLFRSPEQEDNDRGGRTAYFGHRPKIETDCPLRTKRAEGKKYS